MTMVRSPGGGRIRLLLAAPALVLAASGTIVQARLNAELVHLTDNALEVSLLNFILAGVIASAVVLATPVLRRSWGVMVAAVRGGELRPWQVAGGALGGYYIAIQGTATLAFGAAVFTVAVVAGQTSTALVVDRLGIGPMGPQDVSARRLIAAVIAVAAVLLSVSARIGHSDTSMGTLLPVLLLAISAGVASAFQQAVNGRVSAVAGRAVVAAWVNFTVGAVLVALLVGLLRIARGTSVSALPLDRWWLLLGGVFGLIYIATVAWVVRFVGVLVTTLLTLVGLLSGSLLLDIFVPTPGTEVSWQLITAVALTACAVALASLRSGPRGSSRSQ